MFKRILHGFIVFALACAAEPTSTNSLPPAPPPPPPPSGPTVATVALSPTGAFLISIGGYQTLTATLRDANGVLLTGRTVTWSSDNTGVATVENGYVTGVGVGDAIVRAASEGKTSAGVIISVR